MGSFCLPSAMSWALLLRSLSEGENAPDVGKHTLTQVHLRWPRGFHSFLHSLSLLVLGCLSESGTGLGAGDTSSEKDLHPLSFPLHQGVVRIQGGAQNPLSCSVCLHQTHQVAFLFQTEASTGAMSQGHRLGWSGFLTSFVFPAPFP